MNTYEVKPRDPLCLRDGRPMGTGATSVVTLPMPWPSSVAGLARTRRFTNETTGAFVLPKGGVAEVLELAIRGPWLVASDGKRYYPAPLDCVFEPKEANGKNLRRIPLLRSHRHEGILSDLSGLDPVAPAKSFEGKATKGPSFWSEDEIVDWLMKTRAVEVVPEGFGLDALPRERRTHVAIDAARRTASDGQLFSIESLSFSEERPRGLLSDVAITSIPRDFAVGFATDANLSSSKGIVVLGGERRPSFFAKRGAEPFAGKALPTFKKGDLARIVLLTPAVFAAGAVPKAIFGADVVAAVTGRPEVVSGWDFDAKKPKPTRRVVPAGAVYWVRVEDPEAWVGKVWGQNVSDNEQDRRDGFGLAVVGRA